jgi:hypothetical protein
MAKHKQLYLLNMIAFDNVLTQFIPDLYQDLDVVSRELVGMIPSVGRNTSGERAAVGESILIPVSGAQTAFDIAPAMNPPEPADFTVGDVEMKITKSRAVAFGMVGEQQRGLNNGVGSGVIINQQFAQALRTLTNEMEYDLALEGAMHASRAWGTAGTTPFATNVGDTAQLGKILDDNGAPRTNRSLVIDTSAGASLRTLNNLSRANEAGTTMTLRDGELLNLNRFSIKESAQIVRPVVGTGADTGDTTNAGFAVGATSIIVGAGGTGTILAGDYVTFAGDTNKYLVKQGIASLAAGGTMIIAAPGLRVAIPAATTEITVVARSVRSLGFTDNAIQLICRAPALPDGDDAATDSFTLIDPRSGIPFEVRVYKGYRKVRYEVAAAWGVKAIKDEHIAALLG